MAFAVTCEGVWATGAGGEPICAGVLSSVDVATWGAQFDVSQLDPATLAQFWASGFTIVGMAWFIGLCIRLVLQLIKGG